MTDREYLTTPEAAKYLSVSIQFLEISRHKGAGPKYVKLSRMVRYPREELDRFMREHTRSNTCERPNRDKASEQIQMPNGS